jgi:hypothetical protein
MALERRDVSQNKAAMLPKNFWMTQPNACGDILSKQLWRQWLQASLLEY